VTLRGRTSIWRFAVSQALIVLTAWLSVAPALHGGGHDQDCDPAILFHDASNHRLTASSTGTDSAPGDHCVACHLFRSSRHAASWRFLPQGLDGHSLDGQSDTAAITIRAALPLPARAPPALA
jgi:hypothetical protein